MSDLFQYKCVVLAPLTHKDGIDIPHIEWSHQSDDILTVFGEFEFGDFGWIEIRRVIFLQKSKVRRCKLTQVITLVRVLKLIYNKVNVPYELLH